MVRVYLDQEEEDGKGERELCVLTWSADLEHVWSFK